MLRAQRESSSKAATEEHPSNDDTAEAVRMGASEAQVWEHTRALSAISGVTGVRQEVHFMPQKAPKEAAMGRQGRRLAQAGVPDRKGKAARLEVVPWGIAAVEANASTAVAAAKKVINTVLFCILSTGACPTSKLAGFSACASGSAMCVMLAATPKHQAFREGAGRNDM
jgi:hypothetical protein